MTFLVLFVCICVLNYCHRVATTLQLNILYHINSVPIMENRGAGRRGRRRKQLLDDLKEKTGYWKF